MSQTSGPEAVLAGELELPYAFGGLPVVDAAGVAGASLEPREDPVFDHGYV